jgi:hypothetical protein
MYAFLKTLMLLNCTLINITTSLNFSDESSNDNELAQFPNHDNYSCDVKREVSINVIVEQRMVRFRYDSELSNRNYGKEPSEK